MHVDRANRPFAKGDRRPFTLVAVLQDNKFASYVREARGRPLGLNQFLPSNGCYGGPDLDFSRKQRFDPAPSLLARPAAPQWREWPSPPTRPTRSAASALPFSLLIRADRPRIHRLGPRARVGRHQLRVVLPPKLRRRAAELEGASAVAGSSFQRCNVRCDKADPTTLKSADSARDRSIRSNAQSVEEGSPCPSTCLPLQSLAAASTGARQQWRQAAARR